MFWLLVATLWRAELTFFWRSHEGVGEAGTLRQFALGDHSLPSLVIEAIARRLPELVIRVRGADVDSAVAFVVDRHDQELGTADAHLQHLATVRVRVHVRDGGVV